MRLIDADAFEIEVQHEWENNEISNGEWMGIRQWLKDAPTIEAEPVVRCKDCKYAHLTYGGTCKYCDAWEEVGEVYLDGNFYCAFGERKDNETN